MTDPWPWPEDLPVDRARRIANSLLALLSADEAARHVATARRLGETWLGAYLLTYTPDQAITTAEAAQLLSVSEDTIRQWACKPHPDDPTRPLLPRAGRRGRQQTYLVRCLFDAAQHARSRRLTKPL